MRVFLRALSRYLLIALFQIIRWLPLRWACALGSAVMSGVSLFLRGQRRIAADNLRQSFPSEMPPDRVSSIITRCFGHIGRSIAEMFHFYHDPEDMMNSISVEGLENLEAALARGKGVVAMTAHLGNFPLMIGYFALKGYMTRVILKPPRDGKLTHFFENRWSVSSGARVIYSMPRLTCIHQALKVLRDNGLLFILPDQNFGDDGRVFVRFFGRLAATGTGPLVFARRSGASILPVFMTRNADGTQTIVIEKPMDAQAEPVDKQTELVATQAFTAMIEKHIRRSPEQWLWFHKRWKTQPQDDDVVIKS